MKGPHPHFHLLCCSYFPTKKRSYQPSFSCDKNNDATNRLWAVFVFGRWRNSEKRTKPSKKRFAQGYRLGFLQWRKSHERMTTVSVFLEKNTPVINKARWGEDHQFNMYILHIDIKQVRRSKSTKKLEARVSCCLLLVENKVHLCIFYIQHRLYCVSMADYETNALQALAAGPEIIARLSPWVSVDLANLLRGQGTLFGKAIHKGTLNCQTPRFDAGKIRWRIR